MAAGIPPGGTVRERVPAAHPCLHRLNRGETGAMSVLLVKTAEQKIQSRIKPGFHRLMACACSVVLLVTLLACKLTSLRLPDPLGLTIGLVFLSAVVLVVTIYWHEKEKIDLRDAVLTIPWGFFLAITIP